jgi:23S rRNA (uracil1939-C5)-methyltransferase
VAVGEEVTALVLRIMAPLSRDEVLLKAFADQWNIQWWLQTKGPETAAPYYPLGKELYYTLPEFGVRMPFKPTDFTQVNHQINRVLVHKALRLLEVAAERPRGRPVLRPGQLHAAAGDPGARSGGHRRQHRADERALDNAKRQRPVGKDQLLDAQPVRSDAGRPGRAGRFDRMLIDPPRDGAMALAKALAELRAGHPELLPKRIVYVSCSPSTLARDAGILVHRWPAMSMKKAGVVNMFPHTSHVESIGVIRVAKPVLAGDTEAPKRANGPALRLNSIKKRPTHTERSSPLSPGRRWLGRINLDFPIPDVSVAAQPSPPRPSRFSRALKMLYTSR